MNRYIKLFIIYAYITSSALFGMKSELFYFNGTTQPAWKELDIQQLGKEVALINPRRITNILTITNGNSNSMCTVRGYLLEIDTKINQINNGEKNLYLQKENILSNYVAEWQHTSLESEKVQKCALKYALLKKIKTYPQLKLGELLKSTGNKEIIYDSADPFLGRNELTNPHGQNNLGIILMEIRTELFNAPTSPQTSTNDQVDQLLKKAAAELKSRPEAKPKTAAQSAMASKAASIRTRLADYRERFSNWRSGWWHWFTSILPRWPFGKKDELGYWRD